MESYEGDILFNDEAVAFSGITDRRRKRHHYIHQELALVPLLSIAENPIFR